MKAKQIKLERPRGQADVELTFIAEDGAETAVTVGPGGQSLLVSLLLASAKGRVVGEHFELTAPPIRASSFQNFVLSDDLAGLQIGIQDGKAAMHVAFDGQVFAQLRAAVDGLIPKGSAPPPQPPTEQRH